MRFLALLVALGAGPSCSSNDTEQGTAVDASITTDGGVPHADAGVTCAAAGDCPCFSNYDCPDTHACTSLDESGENVWCLEGPRGTGEPGEACVDEADCASALCVEAGEDDFRCSDLCETGDTCPEDLPRCLYIGFGVDESICAPPAPE